jgi:hypothetical protein
MTTNKMIKLLISLAAVAAIAAASTSAAVEFPNLEDLEADVLQDDVADDEVEVADNVVEDHLDQAKGAFACSRNNECFNDPNRREVTSRLQEDLQQVEETAVSGSTPTIRRVCCLPGYFGFYPNNCQACRPDTTSNAAPVMMRNARGLNVIKLNPQGHPVCRNARADQCRPCPSPRCQTVQINSSGARVCKLRYACLNSPSQAPQSSNVAAVLGSDQTLHSHSTGVQNSGLLPPAADHVAGAASLSKAARQAEAKAKAEAEAARQAEAAGRAELDRRVEAARQADAKAKAEVEAARQTAVKAARQQAIRHGRTKFTPRDVNFCKSQPIGTKISICITINSLQKAGALEIDDEADSDVAYEDVEQDEESNDPSQREEQEGSHVIDEESDADGNDDDIFSRLHQDDSSI